MTENTAPAITTPAAHDADTDTRYLVALLRKEAAAAGKWSGYVKRYGVTEETVKEHAAALVALALPNVPEEERVTYFEGTTRRTPWANALNTARTGLRRALGVESNSSRNAGALLTAAGVNATLAEVEAAWHAAQGDA
jgi:hypothetical protein